MYILVSFDVVSLFTNVPVELAISIVEKRLDEVDVSDHTPMTKEMLVSLLRLCLLLTTFHINGRGGDTGGAQAPPLLA